MPVPVRWDLGQGRELGPSPYMVMAVINTTPDSFYDGGLNEDAAQASRSIAEALDSGAAIIDVGGESTRPGAREVSAEEEKARVLPVVEAAVQACQSRVEDDAAPRSAVSVDTSKAEVAEAALDAGASIVNDVSACRFSPLLLDVLAERKPGYVLMHSLGRPETMQDDPKYDDVVAEVGAFFEDKLNMLVRAGLPEEHIVLDPGIGFGKTLEHNLALLRGVEDLQRFGRPLLVGLSNKFLWGQLLGLEVHERAIATMAATSVMYAKGVTIHRVHEPKHAAQALVVARALM
ncbi:MAG: dihydropteroate synthase [Desulfovibrio sp.]|nr:MAG: dihydropteroate synthase [Desulfovibrio sp.]